METQTIAPFDVKWGTVNGTFGELSNKLTACDSCHQPGIFTYDQKLGVFWRGDRRLLVYFDPIDDILRAELIAYHRRRRDPSPEIRRLIKDRAIRVAQAFGDNLGEEF
jgi:hypothetical protein